MATLHYASGNNINSQGNFAPAKAGFNLADVSSVEELNALPPGVKGLVWLDQGDGVTQSFIDAVTPYIGNPNVYGFFLKDEPDPTGQWGDYVTAANLKAESDWIHSHVTGAKTFITMMNMGSSDDPSFANTYTPENTHIDLFGIDPYPVRSGGGPVDYSMIDKAVAAAEESGIPTANIVPVFQTFGGGNWVNDEGGRYVMPTAEQSQQMLAHWQAVVPNAAFDYAYSWGSQNGDVSLENSPELQNVFLQHNTSGGGTVVAAPDRTACYRHWKHTGCARYRRDYAARYHTASYRRGDKHWLALGWRFAERSRHLRRPKSAVGGTITTMDSISRNGRVVARLHGPDNIARQLPRSPRLKP